MNDWDAQKRLEIVAAYHVLTTDRYQKGQITEEQYKARLACTQEDFQKGAIV